MFFKSNIYYLSGDGTVSHCKDPADQPGYDCSGEGGDDDDDDDDNGDDDKPDVFCHCE